MFSGSPQEPKPLDLLIYILYIIYCVSSSLLICLLMAKAINLPQEPPSRPEYSYIPINWSEVWNLLRRKILCRNGKW